MGKTSGHSPHRISERGLAPCSHGTPEGNWKEVHLPRLSPSKLFAGAVLGGLVGALLTQGNADVLSVTLFPLPFRFIAVSISALFQAP